MNLLEPQYILLILFTWVIFAIFAIWGYRVGTKRRIGSAGGLLLGLFLNFIGIIIVYCTNKVEKKGPYNFASAADELQKYKQLLDSGAITEAEYNLQKAKVLNPN